jgi:predicted permease
VTANFFEVMRVKPALGRVFKQEEEGPRAAHVAVISHALWRGGFGGATEVLGRSVRLNGTPHTIIGVMPPGFGQPQGTEVWLPFDLPEDLWTAVVGGRQLNNYARLAPGVTTAAADEELEEFATRAIEAEPNNKDWGWRVRPLRENLLDDAYNALIFVQTGAAILLILAVSNLSSLLLAWAAERQRETAMRLALGASGWRLARQFLGQSLLLVTTGGGLGVLLAAASLPVLRKLNPNPDLAAFLEQLELDGGTLGFAAALVLGTGLIVGLLPAWQARTISISKTLRTESHGASAGGPALQWQQAMVVLQAAISVIILVAATLAGIGFWKLIRVQPGFATEQRVAFRIQFPEPAYGTHEKRVAFVRELESNLALESAIASHGFVSSLPVGDIQWGGGFFPQLANGEFTKEPVVFHFRRTAPGYLETMAIPLIEGRLIDERDRADAPPVAVISKTAAGAEGRADRGNRRCRRRRPRCRLRVAAGRNGLFAVGTGFVTAGLAGDARTRVAGGDACGRAPRPARHRAGNRPLRCHDAR